MLLFFLYLTQCIIVWTIARVQGGNTVFRADIAYTFAEWMTAHLYFHCPWVRKIPWRRKWQPILAFSPGDLHGQWSLAAYNPWGCEESDMTEQLTLSLFTFTLPHSGCHSRGQKVLDDLFQWELLVNISISRKVLTIF